MPVMSYFFDPVCRAPVIGSMLMCMSSALIGAFMVVRRQSLIGEALSHAAYPGVVLSVTIASLCCAPTHPLAIVMILGGAFASSFLGLWVLEGLQRRYRIHLDAALCFVLSVFLGIGVVLASRVQYTHPLWYQQSQVFIYGQAATMRDVHIAIYGTLSLLLVGVIVLHFRALELVLFDSQYAYSLGVRAERVMRVLFLLLIVSIVVGIRSVGVILLSGMLLAPAVAARAFTDRFPPLLLLSGAFGLVSGFGGNYLSLQWSAHGGVSYPTGPMILLTQVTLSLLSLLLAPQRGAIPRMARSFRFRRKCQLENILKTLWKGGAKCPMSEGDILKWNPMGGISLRWALWTLKREGWLGQTREGTFLLSSDGVQRAAHLVRLHRLWELYLVSCLKVDEARVHHSAEEIEHILTPDLERRLTALLNDPEKDPHHRPIPQGDLP